MHIVIGVLTALAGLIWALVAMRKAGIDIGWLNPFLWHRRQQWHKKYGGKPLYKLSDPMDLAAVLILGVTKCEGEISAEQKRQVLGMYENEFHLKGDEASDLLLASAHLIRDEVYLVDNLDKILENSAAKFTPEQVRSLVALMTRAANVEGTANGEQEELISAVEGYFAKRGKNRSVWQ